MSRKLTPVFNALLNLLKDKSGNTAMMFAISLPPLLGAVGCATDMTMLQMKRNALQIAADTAALGAANELAVANYKVENIKAVAETFAKKSLSHQSKEYTVDATVDKKQLSVEVTLTEKWEPFFAQYFNASVTPIVVTSKAQLIGQANVCMLSLDDKSPKAIHLDNKARLNANRCAVNKPECGSGGRPGDNKIQSNVCCWWCQLEPHRRGRSKYHAGLHRL
jgi:Flp pilus assembly protein TadG